MKANNSMLAVGAVALLAGCASGPNRQTLMSPPREHRTGQQALDDLRPIPVVTQHEGAFSQPPEERTDRGLRPMGTGDALVRTQDPRSGLNLTPSAVGAPAASQSATVTMEDAELIARVKEAISKINNVDQNSDLAITSLETNGEKKGTKIDVSASRGLVTIIGSVGSDADRSAIEQAASRVPGVISVSNYLTVSNK